MNSMRRWKTNGLRPLSQEVAMYTDDGHGTEAIVRRAIVIQESHANEHLSSFDTLPELTQ